MTASQDCAMRILDRALCNFCNQVGDPFEPVAKWNSYVERGFRQLSDAYNVAHATGCFKNETPDREA